MPFTFHCHSGEFCLHASGTLEQVVKEAISKNFKILGLSEHAPRVCRKDFYPEESHLQDNDLLLIFQKYINTARELQEKYKDKIKILVGMETEWISGSLTYDQLNYIQTYKPDYIVGSIHHVNGIPIDFDLETYNRAIHSCDDSTELLFQSYFLEQLDMIKSLKPQIIGHFDLIRIFSPEHPFSQKTLEILSESIDFAVSYGALFEVNSRAYKKKLEYPYPHPQVIKLIIEKGGKFTISDDSHAPSELGLFYSKLNSFLKEMNISVIHCLDTDEHNNIIVKEYNNFFDDAFWNNI
ncbi:hypothetical protein BB561_005738 [Smittium simulii]|uniref:Histidinol-phosphatase n=1 Tax=Smittium simulii TaxID=133385 RepID=A0A2T9Y8L7_9FUNG|nr:hypothetical protein BB561_005738 [Smittium simulii]